MFEDILYKKDPNPSEIVYHANMNAYLLLTGILSVDDLLTERLTDSYCVFDPQGKMSRVELENVITGMLDYFSSTDVEDYEKCAMLRDYSYERYIVTVADQQW